MRSDRKKSDKIGRATTTTLQPPEARLHPVPISPDALLPRKPGRQPPSRQNSRNCLRKVGWVYSVRTAPRRWRMGTSPSVTALIARRLMR